MASFEDILRELDGDMAALQSAFDKFMSEKKGEAEAKPKKGGRKPKSEKAKKGDDKEPEVEAVAEAEKKVEADAEAEKKVDETKKNVPRVTNPIAENLKKALTSAGISCDDEKAFKHAKEEFRNYVNSLTTDDYKKQKLEEHMRDFAGIKNWIEDKPKKGGRKPKKGEAEAEPEKKGEAEAEPEKKKPGRKRKGDDKEPEAATGGGAANVPAKTLTLTELMERSERLVPSGKPGEYFDPETGDTVMGPEEPDGLEDNEFNGKTYGIGVKTGVVYEAIDGRDVIVGFKGAGKFKDME